MSLWSINEVSTSNINQSLLKNLTNHVPKDIALQRAKCAYLLSADSKGTKSLAYYWAGLVVVGNIEPIDLRQSASHFLDYIAVFVLLFFVGGFLFWKERKEKKSIA